MPFLIIKGSFHLVGKSRQGNPSGFQPDGDSIQFRPDDPSLLDRLERVDKPYRLTSIGSTQLRFEGIDALELHFEGHHQPRPLADHSRDYLTGLLAMNPVTYRPPDHLTVKPPVAHDGARGYILARELEAHGRPVSFAFAGKPGGADGAKLTLRTALLKRSLNYKSLASGNSYSLFYDTLFASVRASFAQAARSARAAKKGLWKDDRSTKGVGRRERKWSREAWRHLPEGVPPPDELLRRRWQWALRITSLARADEGAGARPDDGELHPPRQCARGEERQDPLDARARGTRHRQREDDESGDRALDRALARIRRFSSHRRCLRQRDTGGRRILVGDQANALELERVGNLGSRSRIVGNDCDDSHREALRATGLQEAP
jgi:endonuclease YncB( thermonuclease family)